MTNISRATTIDWFKSLKRQTKIKLTTYKNGVAKK
jgi:hypothetical protein